MATEHTAPIRVVQITDTHLGNREGDPLMGLDADMSLGLVLQQIRDQHPALDVLLATGDISNCGSLESYSRFANLIDGLATHNLWLPGNHDLPDVMAEARGGELQRSFEIGDWLILMLDSTARGEVGGSFSEQELEFLRDELARSGARHVLVCLHHHPVDSGCDWLDQQRVTNAEEFFGILGADCRIRAVLWGHIHQEIDRMQGDIRLLATPSTCIQFAPASEGFKLDPQGPGFRTLTLHPDGKLETAVTRVDTVFDLDYQDSAGY